LRFGGYAAADRDELVRELRLSDGGVYDNMGLEPVWKSSRVVLVSDGGGVFEREAGGGRLGRVARQLAIVESQSRSLRKRWLIASFLNDELDGAYWGIGSTTDHYKVSEPGYSPSLVDTRISEIRTDLDAFSAAEIAVLENHGYLMADAALRTHLPALIRSDAPPILPHPDWRDEAKADGALAKSHRRSLLGRWR
jgi:NTE family protein